MVAATGCSPSTDGQSQTGWAVGVDPIPTDAIAVMADHQGALVRWAESGARGRTVVHIDAHDDFRFIPEEQLAPALDAIADGDAQSLASLADNESVAGAYSLGNYLYPAAVSGTVDHIVWVAPGAPGDTGGLLATWQSWLREQRYPEDEVSALRVEDGCVVGTLLGTQVTIATPQTLPSLNESVLLDIDMDFFPEYVGVAAYDNATGAVRDLVAALAEAGIRTDEVTIAKSAYGDFMPMQYLWMTDLLYVTLTQPSTMQDGPSARWSVMGEALAREAATGEPDPEAWRLAVDMAPGDPAAWFGDGRALALSDPDSVSEAAEALQRAYQLDPLFGQGFLQLALELNLAGRYDAALTMVENARGKAPAFFAELRRADTLYNAGRYEEALPIYEALAEGREHPYVWLSLADTYRMLGDSVSARDAYAEAEKQFAASSLLSPLEYPDSLPYLAEAAEARGDTETALFYYREYLERRPDGDQADVARRRVSELESD
ncbi:MAG: hypothetical protein Kow0056_12320 [Coriobacteriia bacterium]